MRCFRCLKELEPVFPDESKFEDYRQPNGGLIFTARGNYGSRVYDPVMSAPDMVIWVCDDCIRGNLGLVQMRRFAEVRTEVVWSDFDPERAYW